MIENDIHLGKNIVNDFIYNFVIFSLWKLFWDIQKQNN